MRTATRPKVANPSRAEQFRVEIRQAQQRAHEAVDRLDVTEAIANARTLRSLLWNAQRLGIDVKPDTQEKPECA